MKFGSASKKREEGAWGGVAWEQWLGLEKEQQAKGSRFASLNFAGRGASRSEEKPKYSILENLLPSSEEPKKERTRSLSIQRGEPRSRSASEKNPTVEEEKDIRRRLLCLGANKRQTDDYRLIESRRTKAGPATESNIELKKTDARMQKLFCGRSNNIELSQAQEDEVVQEDIQQGADDFSFFGLFGRSSQHDDDDQDSNVESRDDVNSRNDKDIKEQTTTTKSHMRMLQCTRPQIENKETSSHLRESAGSVSVDETRDDINEEEDEDGIDESSKSRLHMLRCVHQPRENTGTRSGSHDSRGSVSVERNRWAPALGRQLRCARPRGSFDDTQSSRFVTSTTANSQVGSRADTNSQLTYDREPSKRQEDTKSMSDSTFSDYSFFGIFQCSKEPEFYEYHEEAREAAPTEIERPVNLRRSSGTAYRWIGGGRSKQRDESETDCAFALASRTGNEEAEKEKVDPCIYKELEQRTGSSGGPLANLWAHGAYPMKRKSGHRVSWAPLPPRSGTRTTSQQIWAKDAGSINVASFDEYSNDSNLSPDHFSLDSLNAYTVDTGLSSRYW